ncbi:hypothetical protein ACI7BZ_01275 [Xanthobacter sp. AM11]|uniref:hypothetical protein n=1 Tax=Xanthobacter sp. AM11 TaxID=3380643 RepID=UPI0039BFDB95
MALLLPALPAGAQCTTEDAGPARATAAVAGLGIAPVPASLSLRLLPVADGPLDRASPLPLTQPDPYRPYQGRPAAGPPRGPEQVAASLRSRGFVEVSAVRQRGRTFLAEATGPRGERVRLVIDGASGEISGMQVIGFDTPR